MNFDIISEKFPESQILIEENSISKVRALQADLLEIITFLQNVPEYSFNMLMSLICVDFGDEENAQGQMELIYNLYSTENNKFINVSVLIDRKTPAVDSLISLYKSAYFDECEVYDMFGVEFRNNPDLKRLFMPKGWVGHPMKKDYKLEDERLVWNNG